MKSEKTRALIFSQHSNFLAVVRNVLRQEGIHNSFVDGNVVQKKKSLKKFLEQDDTFGECRVILLSLDNCAAGTNLTSCSHVIFLDPPQGPIDEVKAIEAQAIGRAFRIGQTQQVTVVRFIVKGTIEEQFHQAMQY